MQDIARFSPPPGFVPAALAMAAIITASNVLVQFPLGDWLTWGAFSYPFAFLVTDLANRRHGARMARRVVFVGFGVAVVLSLALAGPRVALASGGAFLASNLLDVAVFDRLRAGTWWRAPLISSALASLLDTTIFFSLAFSAGFTLLGPTDPFALEPVALLGGAARWIGWALGDLGVKLGFALALLIPYRAFAGAAR